jgi:hypothetical protein
MSAHADDMVLVPRSELGALRAENRRLRREAGDREALRRIRADSGDGRTYPRDDLADACGISERQGRSLSGQDLRRIRALNQATWAFWPGKVADSRSLQLGQRLRRRLPAMLMVSPASGPEGSP